MKPQNLVLGIDTGGTYTDAVLMDHASRQVLAACKRLTTRQDFALGIEAVIDGIQIDDPAMVKMVSISTTLATNAIAEGKGRRVGLLLIGYDPELIAKFRMDRQFGPHHYAFVGGGHDFYGREKEPLDLPALEQQVMTSKDQVAAFAVSSYFSPLNPTHENEAFTAIRRLCDLPVVLGHHLSTRLGSVERATTAAINASLLAVLHDLITDVQRVLAHRQIDAPLMVVRGDGTLMSAGFAKDTPVETIHSGPAASAIGGRFLCGQDDALVIDVGGTTTDIALVINGEVAVSAEGARVNGYKTAVQAANILSIPLGGDSHIHLGKNGKLKIGPERVVPLAYLADRFPQVRRHLRILRTRMQVRPTADWLEFWYLIPDYDEAQRAALTADDKALVKLLQAGPLPLPTILLQMELLHPGQLAVDNLWRREIIGKAGLTPTDLLHAEGKHTPWAVESAEQAVDLFYRFLFPRREDLHQQVWRRMTEKVLRAVVIYLTGKNLPDLDATPEADRLDTWFFENALYSTHAHLESRLRLRAPIIGIGAPAHHILPRVAELLHTELLLPPHHAVANAVGTVASNVMTTAEALVYPHLSAEGFEVLGYYVQAGEGRYPYETLEAALAQARALTREQSLAEAGRAGALNPQVSVRQVENGLDSFRIQARAVGTPRLGS